MKNVNRPFFPETRSRAPVDRLEPLRLLWVGKFGLDRRNVADLLHLALPAGPRDPIQRGNPMRARFAAPSGGALLRRRVGWSVGR